MRISVARPAAEVWLLACNHDSWAAMPGAQLSLDLTPAHAERRLEYAVAGGLPVIDHQGVLTVSDTVTGGTELCFTESFRPRIWGTGSFLRGRRERTLIDTAQSWDRRSPESAATAQLG
ncbi:MAG: hypothetical protein LH616_13060 [Ilumatobacteraceae bacterium]|nr:hypothetical protein [Ilumatobacteraceae bacterium]